MANCVMEEKVMLKDWDYDGEDRVRLLYQDGTELYVDRRDFSRAFGCIIALDKATAKRDFAIKNV